MVIGAPDVGKTTWIAFAASHLASRSTLPIAIVDADIGQASIGPPGTVGMTLIEHPPAAVGAFARLPCHAMVFVGSVSPLGHLLQLITSTARLVDTAKQQGAQTVLVDTTGLVSSGIGFQLKLRKVELLRPTHIVAIQRHTELEPLLTVVGMHPGCRTHRLRISHRSRSRTIAERAAYRAERFTDYFALAQPLALRTAELPILNATGMRDRLRGPGASDFVTAETLRRAGHQRTVLGLNSSADETLALGVLEGVTEEGDAVVVNTPWTEASVVRMLQLGSIRLDSASRRGYMRTDR